MAFRAYAVDAANLLHSGNRSRLSAD